MGLTNEQLVTLKTELETDPKALGYAGKTDQEIADLLNTVGLSSETVNRGVIDSHEVVSACVNNDYKNLTADQKTHLTFITSAGQVNASDSKIKTVFQDMFGPTTETRDNLLALSTRPASRAEVLFNSNVSLVEVHKARRL